MLPICASFFATSFALQYIKSERLGYYWTAIDVPWSIKSELFIRSRLPKLQHGHGHHGIHLNTSIPCAGRFDIQSIQNYQVESHLCFLQNTYGSTADKDLIIWITSVASQRWPIQFERQWSVNSRTPWNVFRFWTIIFRKYQLWNRTIENFTDLLWAPLHEDSRRIICIQSIFGFGNDD